MARFGHTRSLARDVQFHVEAEPIAIERLAIERLVRVMNTEIIERIELKIAYLERANNDLSEVVYRQQQEIDALRAKLAVLNGKMEAAMTEPTVYSLEQEKPPHY